MFDINLKNFRSFKDQDFNFSKINILIGENSSGKSSIFKYFLALKQTFQTPNNRETNFEFNGEFADLGSYKESVYYHNEDLPIEFSFTFGKEFNDFAENFISLEVRTKEQKDIEIKKFRDLISGPIETDTTISHKITNQLDKHETIETSFVNESIGSLKIIHQLNQTDDDKKFFKGPKCTLIYFDKYTTKDITLDNIQYEKDGPNTLIVGTTLMVALQKEFNITNTTFELEDLSDEEKLKVSLVEVLFHKIAFLLISQNFLKLKTEKIEYINPIDTHPSRVYLYKDEKQNQTIKSIEDVVDFFSRNNDISRHALIDFIRILKTFGIADDIEVIKDSRLPVRELRVKVNDLLSNIKDVGYGVSLQLPIILKALLAERFTKKNNSILLIEQPEVHLHPKLHAKLIETIIELSTQTTYFIETHSEHIIRKLQVMIKEGKYNIKPEDITIHYLRRIKKGTEVTQHFITDKGFLEPKFPSGFFDNSYNLSKELLQ